MGKFSTWGALAGSTGAIVFEQITILAPGLLGASVAAAVKDRLLTRRTVIWARRAETRVACSDKSWCDQVVTSPEEAVRGADLVVVCSPVETIHPLVVRIAPHLKEGALVTDVGSAKSLIVRYCHTVMPKGRQFIGSHPMAGSEKSGLAHASKDLFCGKTCFVTPLVDSGEQAVETIIKFWKDLDMEVASVSPERHDEIVAHISHLPHLLACVLCSFLSTKDSGWINFAGDGLGDTTRVAAGSPAIWKSIFEQNREEIARAIDQFENELQSLKSAIATGQSFDILNHLERGRAYRERLRPAAKD